MVVWCVIAVSAIAFIRTATSKNFLQIELSGLHNASIHENDCNKYLKFYQIILIHDVAVTSPSLPGVLIRQNMLKTIAAEHKRCAQRRVRAACQESTVCWCFVRNYEVHEGC